MAPPAAIPLHVSFLLLLATASFFPSAHSRILKNPSHFLDPSLTYLWPFPKTFEYGDAALSVDPALELVYGGGSEVVREAFERYKRIIFGYHVRAAARHSHSSGAAAAYNVTTLSIMVASDNETLNYAVDESYSLYVGTGGENSIVQGATIEANTIYGALRGLETFSQLCSFDYKTKEVEIDKAPWYIYDEPRFPFRGLLLDTSRHYLPVRIIKQIIDSMSYAKLNVLHWHIVDEQSFPIEIPSYPNLWKGSYTKWERYTVEDAVEIVDFAKKRGINVLAEIDVPGHGESWGTGYPDLWPSLTCKEPLDVSKSFTFEVISGMLSDLRKIFPFDFFHLGGDEVNTGCWESTPHVKQWLEDHNMTAKDAYQYFVLRAQDIAHSQNWVPVNWEETFIAFDKNLNPETVVHNWLNSGVCPNAVAKGFRCIFSNQGYWYLDHLDVPWEGVYNVEPLEGIHDPSLQKLVLGGEVCMWGETADPSNVLQTIWPRAAAAAERLWSDREATSHVNTTLNVLPRLEYFRCLLNRRGVPTAPVTNFYARQPPIGPGSCYEQ